MPQPYTDQQAIRDGLLKPGELGDTSLAEADAAGNTGGSFSPRDKSGAAPNEVSAEEFFAVGAEKPIAKNSFTGEASAEDFFGVKADKAEPSGRLAQPGDKYYKEGTNRIVYDKGITGKDVVSGTKVLGETGVSMLTGWLGNIPAGLETLAKKIAQENGYSISDQQIEEGLRSSQQFFTYEPRSKEAQIIGEALGGAYEGGLSGIDNRVSQQVYDYAISQKLPERVAQNKAAAAGTTAKAFVDSMLNILPIGSTFRGAVKLGAKTWDRLKPVEPPPPEIDPYNYKSPAKQGPPRPDNPTLHVDPQGNVMTVEALAARDELAKRMPEAFAPAPEMETSSVRGASLASELDKQFEIKTPEGRKILHARRGREIREAFTSDKDYADYLRWYADNQATMAEITPPEVPVAKTRLPGEPVIIGETLPRQEFPGLVGQLDSYQSGLQKVQQGKGFDLTAEELSAVRNLSSEHNRPQIAQMKVEAGRAVEVLPSKEIPVDPKIITALGAAGVTAVAGQDLFSEDSPLKGAALVALGVGAGSKFKLHGDLRLGSAITLTKNTIPGEGPVRVTHWLDGKPIAHDHFASAVEAEKNFNKAVKADTETAKALKEIPSETVSADNVTLLKPSGQVGIADPKLLGRLAAIGIGAAAGAALDPENPFEGAVIGSLTAGVATMGNPKQVISKIKGFFESDKRFRITDLANKYEYAIRAAAREIWKVQNKLIEAVPDPLRRSAIFHWIEGDKSIKLTRTELQAAKVATDFFAGMKEAGLSSGVLKDALENYVTHLWKMDDKLRGMLEARAQVDTMSPNTRFAKHRSVPTLQEGMKPVEDGGWGLTPLTEDISEIVGIYGSSITKAMANRDIIAALKSTKTPEGRSLLEKMDVAPPSYNFINHPQLQGYRVHPDIAPSLRFLFDNKDPNVGIRAIEGLNILSKRMLVSFSMFHAKALVDAYLGAAASGPVGAAKNIPKFLTGDHVLLKQLRTGGAGDLVDKAIKGGLMFSLERALPAVEDVGGSFYGMMKDAQVVADKIIPGAGKAVAGFEKVNHLVDKFMWERLHTGMKLQIFSEKYARLLETNAKASARDPRIPLKSETDIAKMAASFTNDMFGGLNWRRLADEATTKLGRDLALATYSPSGRRALQFLMFAPDWTISTTRAALKSFGKGTGVSGLIEPKTLADLHRQYVLRSALYYGLIGTVLNQAFSGKWLWENADPTYIDMGDGRRMQWSKHTMEPVHWLMHPRQQALNKLSQVIKVPVEQIMGVQYLSASGHAPRIEEGRRLVSIGKALSPIAVQQGFEASEGSGIAGFLGAPIYGKTTEQKAEEKRSKRLDYSGRVEALQRRRERLMGGAQ